MKAVGSRALTTMTSTDIWKCLHPFNLARSKVSAKWSTDFNQKPNQEFEKHVNEIWLSKMSKNDRLYNGTKFRLHSWYMDSGVLTLNVGLTTYKAFIGSNCSAIKDIIVQKGIQDFQNSQTYLADPLGIGVLIKTSNGQLVFIRRSLWCAEEPGMVDVPGGHPEPSAILGDNEPNHDLLTSDAVTNELFASVINEVQDEINLPDNYLEDLVIMGIFRNPKTVGRPVVIFFVNCKLSSESIEEKYKLGSQIEADESMEIIFISERDILAENLNEQEFLPSLTPGAKAAISLYRKIKE